MFIRIKPLISKFSRRPEITHSLQEQKIKKEWQDIIESIHKSARDKSQALYVNDRGELIVKVRDHLWLQELSFYKEEIKKATSKSMSIKSVRFIT